MAAMNDDVDVPRIAVIGICSTLFIYVFITFTRVIFLSQGEDQERIKNYEHTPRALVAYQREQVKKLTGIERSMAAVTREMAQQQKLKSAPSP